VLIDVNLTKAGLLRANLADALLQIADLTEWGRPKESSGNRAALGEVRCR